MPSNLIFELNSDSSESLYFHEQIRYDHQKILRILRFKKTIIGTSRRFIYDNNPMSRWHMNSEEYIHYQIRIYKVFSSRFGIRLRRSCIKEIIDTRRISQDVYWCGRYHFTLVTTRALKEFHWFQYLVHEREEQTHRAHDHRDWKGKILMKIDVRLLMW